MSNDNSNMSNDNSNKEKIAVQKPIEDLKKLFTDRFVSGVNKTNTTLITWAVALFLIILTTIYPLSSQLQSVASERAKLIKKKQKIDFVQKKENSNSSSNNTQNSELETTSKQETNFGGKTKSFEALKNELAEIPLPFGKLPGIKKIYSPVLWSALFAGFLAFFLYVRIKLFSSLARVIDININEYGKKIGEIEGLGSGVPFWLAPLPRSIKTSDGKRISQIHMRRFLGWRYDLKRNKRLTLSCLLFGFSFFLWVIWVVFESLKTLSDPQDGLRILISVIGLFIVSLLACFYWLTPKIELKEFSSRLREESKSRRNFIKAAGVVLGIGIIYVLTPRKILPRALSTGLPRFRKKNKIPFPEQFRNKFWITEEAPNNNSKEKKSRVIYYVGANGFSSSVYYYDKYKTKLKQTKLNPQKLLGLSREEVLATQIKLLTETISPKKNTIKRTSPENNSNEMANQSKMAVQETFSQEEDLIATKQNLRKDKPIPTKIIPNPSKNIPDAEDSEDTNSEQQSLPNHVNFRQFSAVTECLVIEQLQNGNVDGAIDFLMKSIKYSKFNKPNYRLYDLLAGLTYRHSKKEKTEELIKHIKDRWKEDKILNKRKEKWSEPSERWKSKWKSETLKWKTPFKKDSPYFGYF